MSRVVVLPLDDRPVNYDYPRHLAAMAGPASPWTCRRRIYWATHGVAAGMLTW